MCVNVLVFFMLKFYGFNLKICCGFVVFDVIVLSYMWISSSVVSSASRREFR